MLQSLGSGSATANGHGDTRRGRKNVATDASLEGKQRSRRTPALRVSSSSDGLKLTGLAALSWAKGGGVQHIGPRGVHTGPKSDSNN